MAPDAYKVISMAVLDGVTIGVRRAFKYSESPSEEHIIDTVEREVLNQICEWFKFHETHGDPKL